MPCRTKPLRASASHPGRKGPPAPEALRPRARRLGISVMSVTSVAPVALRIEAGRGECDGGHRRFRNTPLRLQDYDRHDSIISSIGWPRLPYLGLLGWNDASPHRTRRL